MLGADVLGVDIAGGLAPHLARIVMLSGLSENPGDKS